LKSLSRNSLPIFFLVVSLTCFCVAGTGSCANVITPELEAALGSLAPGEEISVIVTLADKADIRSLRDVPRPLRRAGIIRVLKAKADLTQGRLRIFLESRRAREIKSLWMINGMAVTAADDLIRELSSFPGVEEIRPDEMIKVPQIDYAASSTPEWNISAINAPALWAQGYMGTGAVVANMDTGVDINHPDLNSKWRGGTNSWFDPNGEHGAPYDADGHGTGTTGVMVGGDAGGTAVGVAPGAQWIAVKVFNDAGRASLSAIHDGFQWLLDPDGNPDTDDAPDVVNNSWGLDGSLNQCITEFEADLRALRASGIAVVFSAGNSGPYSSSSLSPANYPESFAAGAVNETLSVASFSSRGPSACDSTIFPEVVAPGVHIRTSDLTFGGVFPNSYATVNGTSFAAPHVAGAMALLLSAFPGLTVSEVEFALQQSAFDLGMTGADNAYGFGLIDVWAAYDLLQNADVSVSPPSYVFSKTKEGRVSLPQTFTVTNRGSKDLIVDVISLSGIDPFDFLVLTDACSGQILEPVGTCAIEVAFGPTSGGSKSAELLISSDDPDENPYRIRLSGKGLERYNLDVAISGSGAGKVVSEPPGIDCGGDCSGLFGPGTTVTLRAIPEGDSRFGGWSGCNSSYGKTCQVIMGGDKTVTSTFVSAGLSLISPVGGEEWKAGTYKKIKWNYTGKTGAYVKIELIQGETVVKTIAERTLRGTNGTGRFLWFVPKKLPERNDYRIRITSTKNTAYIDTTDLPFTIHR
jgi:serine protease AprX